MAEKPISTGRGGAYNIRPTQSEDVAEAPVPLPHLKTKVVTTGRGGRGNMMENIDPASTRAAQDAPEPESNDLAPTPSRTVGRGGYGNNIRAKQYRQDGSEESSSGCSCF